MKLQIRQYINWSPKFLISIWVGFFATYALGLTAFYLFSNFLHLISLKEHFETFILLALYLLLFNPVVILLTFSIILKYVNSNSPILLSVLIGLLATLVLGSIEYSISSKFDLFNTITNFISTFGLIITWIIVLQTEKNIAKGLSIGFFIFILVKLLFGLIQKNISPNQLDIITLVTSIIGSLIGCALISKIFEQFTKIAFWLFKPNQPDGEMIL